MSEIKIVGLRKEYGPTVAADSVDAVFEAGTVTCLLGPSGCGKTTLLRMIAGLETPDSGQILLGGKDVTKLSTEKRDLGMVFQYPVVYRGMTVAENIGLPLEQARGRSRVSKEERERRVVDMLRMLHLEDVGQRPVEALSNGVRQKVAVARAMIRRPAVVIFDEPVTNVDIVSKLEIQRDIKRLVRELGQTVLYVTHDQTEAMTLADRIVLLQGGRIVESGSPREVFRRPASRFGGHFLGSPGMNFVAAEATRTVGTSASVTSPVIVEPVVFEVTEQPSSECVVGVRAEHIRISVQRTEGSFRARVVNRAVGVGGRWILNCLVGETRVHIKSHRSDPVSLLDDLWAVVPPDAAILFNGAGERIGVGSARHRGDDRGVTGLATGGAA